MKCLKCFKELDEGCDRCPHCGHIVGTIVKHIDTELKKVENSIAQTEAEINKKVFELFPIIVEREHAEHEFFNMYAVAVDIDCNTSTMDVEDKTAFESMTDKLILAIQRGHLTFNDDYTEAIYEPSNKLSTYTKKIVFKQRTGGTLQSMDRKKKSQEIAKYYSVIAEMASLSVANLRTLVGTDIKVCEALFTFLMV